MIQIGILVDSINPDQWLLSMASVIREFGYGVNFIIDTRPAPSVPWPLKHLKEIGLSNSEKLPKPSFNEKFEFVKLDQLKGVDFIIDPTGKGPINVEEISVAKGIFYFNFYGAHQNWVGLSEWITKGPSVGFQLLRFTPQSSHWEQTEKFHSRSNPKLFYKHQRETYSTCLAVLRHVLSSLQSPAASSSIKWMACSSQPIDFGILRNNNSNLLTRSWFALGLFFKRACHQLLVKVFYVEDWVILLGQKSDFLKRGFAALKPIPNRPGYYNADPFIFSHGDHLYLFYEEFSKVTNRGHLACFSYDRRSGSLKQQIVLEKPYHLSYPLVFKQDGLWYMIPESGEKGTVDLYQSTEFPFEWKYIRTLVKDIQAYDSTVFFVQGQYWLFCTVRMVSESSPDTDLCIFYSDDLIHGEWIPHHGNPLKRNHWGSRPAGRIFLDGSALIRPAQISLPISGWGFVFNEIVKLDSDTFEEHMVKEFTPLAKGPIKAMHTYNADGEIVAIDAKVRQSRISLRFKSFSDAFNQFKV